MFRLPDTTPLQGSPVNSQEVSASAMMAPAQALNNLGRELVGVSDQFFGTAVKLQQIENARTVSEKQQQLQEAWSQHSIELERVTDPAQQIEMTRQFFDSHAGMIEDPDLPPAVRDELGGYYNNFRSKQTMATAEGAARLEIRRSTMALQNEADTALRNNDMEGAESAIRRMESAGLILPEEGQRLRSKAQEQIAVNQHESDIMADAAGWLEANPRDKVPAGVDPGRWRTLQNMANTERRNQILDDAEGILDLIHNGSITDAAGLDEVAGHMPASMRLRLQNQLESIQRDDYLKKINSPQYQQEVVGKVASMIANYNPADEGFDSAYVEIDSAIRTLPEGNPVRSELLRQLKEKRDPSKVTATDTGAYRYATDSLDIAAKAGAFGSLSPSLQTVEKAINDGFLRDKAKLGIFFTPEQIAEINAPKLDKDGKQTREASDYERRQRFERLWVNRKADAKADPYTMATAQAIVDQEAEIANPREAARVTAVQRRIGEVRMALASWVKMHPNATATEIDAKVRELAGNAARSAASQSLIPQPPSR